MLIVETIAKIRRMYYVQKKGLKTIARELNLSKNTVKNVIKKDKTAKSYSRNKQPKPLLENFIEELVKKLKADSLEPKYRRRTAKKLYEELSNSGFKGGYTTVNAFVGKWKKENHLGGKKAFIPLEFGAGEAFQFDWSEEEIELKGKLISVKAAHIRLCHSRFFLVIVYRNEQLEMVMDAHDKAFQIFGGVCKKGIYDNMKTVVHKILTGKDRQFNQRFLEMASHYLFEPIACTPSAGWEKGQVENQVSTSRCNFFTPLLCGENLEELNENLYKRCLGWAKKTKHPEFKEKTVWEMYQEEIKYFITYRYPFEGYKIESGVVSSCSLINYATNLYSVSCEYVGEVGEIRVYAKKIIVSCQGKIIAEHERCFEKHQRIYNPLHYLSILEQKPGALRNGAPFKNWILPTSLNKVRQRLEKHNDSEKQFIRILVEISKYGLENVDKACAYVLEQGTCHPDFILRYLKGNKHESEMREEQRHSFKVGQNEDFSDYNQAFLKLQVRQEKPLYAV